VSTDDRLTRLRALIARLERLPASPESEWMLREARARMVDVETGERPGELRPLAVEPPAEAPRRQREAATKRPTEARSSEPEPRRAPPETPPPVESRPLDPGGDDGSSPAPFGTDGLLWLDDSPSEDGASPDGKDGDPKSQPWRRGLRG
jgi:hypothetical protein